MEGRELSWLLMVMDNGAKLQLPRQVRHDLDDGNTQYISSTFPTLHLVLLKRSIVCA